MTTIWPLPQIDTQGLSAISETRPTALLTGRRSWDTVGSLIELPLVVQAEPYNTEISFLDELAEGLPPQVEVIYGVGGGLVCDAAKYIGWKNNLPVIIVPTALSVDGFFTALVAVRKEGTVEYQVTGPVDKDARFSFTRRGSDLRRSPRKTQPSRRDARSPRGGCEGTHQARVG